MRHLFLICLGLWLAGCQNNTESPTDQLGEIHFEFKGDETAQTPFKKGLLLLHNFEYEDAREQFQLAQAADSTMAMAFWGEAMTYNHPLWRSQDFEKGQATLQALGETAADREGQTGSDLEADFIRAVEILFGEGQKNDRDQKYSEHMEYMYAKYPQQQEVAAFYALSILGAVPVGRDITAYEKSAGVAQKILVSNPRHPGALHYLIHSYDDPGHARLALDAAKSYSQVAADAVHALHMPSHIFLAAGMWEEVRNSNIASWEASVRRKEEKELTNNAFSYHALYWLLYSHLQLDEMEEANAIMAKLPEYLGEEPSKGARSYQVEMHGAYLVETDSWDGPFASYEADLEDLDYIIHAMHQFQRGMIALKQEKLDVLKELVEDMQQSRKNVVNLVSETGIPMCSSGASSSYAITQLDIDQGKVLELELRALLADAEKESKTAEEFFLKATELEDKTSYGFGPPSILKPSHELYAEWLLKQGRKAEAAKQFEAALARAPNRRLSKMGLEGINES